MFVLASLLESVEPVVVSLDFLRVILLDMKILIKKCRLSESLCFARSIKGRLERRVRA